MIKWKSKSPKGSEIYTYMMASHTGIYMRRSTGRGLGLWACGLCWTGLSSWDSRLGHVLCVNFCVSRRRARPNHGAMEA